MHVPVLLEEVLRLLDPSPGETHVDATAGAGGHAAPIARRIGPSGRVVLNDADPASLRLAVGALERIPAGDRPEVIAVRGNYALLPRELRRLGIAGDMLVADLGFLSAQVDDPSRGFSFQGDGPLDMRYDPSQPTSAADLVASLSEAELGSILREYGEERHAGRIARKVVRERADAPITTTGRLARIVRAAVGGERGSIDPATRTFQALRIATNDELGSLSALLDAVADRTAGSRWLAPGARVAFICFHSLEDRLVKRAFAEMARRGSAELLVRRPVVVGPAEAAANPRARSARLRAARLT
jgi:16S rRNA (cytosine1402-N4)-methyltransferase